MSIISSELLDEVVLCVMERVFRKYYWVLFLSEINLYIDLKDG